MWDRLRRPFGLPGVIFCALLLSALPGALPGAGTRAQDGQPVPLELVLAVDASSSVDEAEFALQMRGLAAAFREPAVIDALRVTGGAAVAVVQWSQAERQVLAVDWTLVHRGADALALAEAIGATPRLIEGGHTAAGSAIRFAARAFESNGFLGQRRVIDLSGDGRVNDGPFPAAIRDAAIAQGITINGLAILNEIPDLEDYYRAYLIGGAGAFVMTAVDYRDFARAIAAKLIREIRDQPLAQGGGSAATKMVSESMFRSITDAWRPAGRGTGAPGRRRRAR